MALVNEQRLNRDLRERGIYFLVNERRLEMLCIIFVWVDILTRIWRMFVGEQRTRTLTLELVDKWAASHGKPPVSELKVS